MSKSKLSTSMKKSKDPKAPKRFRTGYILFSIEKRDKIKRENPGLSPKEIFSEIAAQWRSADHETKEHFQKLSDTEKAEYGQKTIDYKNNKENENKRNQSMEVNSSQ